MKHVLVVGSGLSGLSCAIQLADCGISSTLVSPYPSERAQSVMAAGGINAAIGTDDSISLHAEDTLHSGGDMAGKEAVEGLCSAAPDIIRWLEGLGVHDWLVQLIVMTSNLVTEFLFQKYVVYREVNEQ